MDLSFLDTQEKKPGLLGAEKVVLGYLLLTTIFIFIFWKNLTGPIGMLTGRVLIVAGIAAFYVLYNIIPTRLTRFLRMVFLLATLSFWYSDTYSFCSMFPYQDHIFAAVDQNLFGCQPALVFHDVLPGTFFSELFYLGYFSYYPMIIAVSLFAFFAHRHHVEKTVFILLFSFMLFYLIYDFLPVAGPQYYFHIVPPAQLADGYFPHIPLNYFRTHAEMNFATGGGGLFQYLVESLQAGGEHPTAAFPSSHVGISTIVMILGFKMSKRFMYILLPFYILLCLSTVYIEAHYAIDVVFGFVSAFLFYRLGHWTYNKSFFHTPHEHHHHHHQ